MTQGMFDGLGAALAILLACLFLVGVGCGVVVSQCAPKVHITFDKATP